MADFKSGAHKHRVLVVDDDASVRAVVAAHLEEEGYKAECVESGEAALKKIAATRYSLAIMDVKMGGGMSGVKAAVAFSEASPELPVLVLSGYIDDAAHAEMETQPNIKGWISKPYESTQLLRMVKRLVESTSE